MTVLGTGVGDVFLSCVQQSIIGVFPALRSIIDKIHKTCMNWHSQCHKTQQAFFFLLSEK